MSRINFFVFQIFFLSSIARADGTLVRPGAFPALFRSVAAFTKDSSGSGAFLPPVIKRAIDSIADLGSNAVPWLGSSALIFKFGRLFQQNLQKAEEIDIEANRRQKLEDGVWHREKSWGERWDERDRRIKELRQKIEEARYSLKRDKEGESVEDMWLELSGLLTEPLKPALDKEDEESDIAGINSMPGTFEQPAVSNPYVVPGMRMIPEGPKKVPEKAPVGDLSSAQQLSAQVASLSLSDLPIYSHSHVGNVSPHSLDNLYVDRGAIIKHVCKTGTVLWKVSIHNILCEIWNPEMYAQQNGIDAARKFTGQVEYKKNFLSSGIQIGYRTFMGVKQGKPCWTKKVLFDTTYIVPVLGASKYFESGKDQASADLRAHMSATPSFDAPNHSECGLVSKLLEHCVWQDALAKVPENSKVKVIILELRSTYDACRSCRTLLTQIQPYLRSVIKNCLDETDKYLTLFSRKLEKQLDFPLLIVDVCGGPYTGQNPESNAYYRGKQAGCVVTSPTKEKHESASFYKFALNKFVPFGGIIEVKSKIKGEIYVGYLFTHLLHEETATTNEQAAVMPWPDPKTSASTGSEPK